MNNQKFNFSLGIEYRYRVSGPRIGIGIEYRVSGKTWYRQALTYMFIRLKCVECVLDYQQRI